MAGKVLQAIMANDYVDFCELLPRMTCGDITPCGTTNKNKNQCTTMESFNIWLEAWTIYEDLLDKDPTHYKELSR